MPGLRARIAGLFQRVTEPRNIRAINGPVSLSPARTPGMLYATAVAESAHGIWTPPQGALRGRQRCVAGAEVDPPRRDRLHSLARSARVVVHDDVACLGKRLLPGSDEWIDERAPRPGEGLGGRRGPPAGRGAGEHEEDGRSGNKDARPLDPFVLLGHRRSDGPTATNRLSHAAACLDLVRRWMRPAVSLNLGSR